MEMRRNAGRNYPPCLPAVYPGTRASTIAPTYTARPVRPLLVVLAAFLVAVPAAQADETIRAGPPNRYLTPNPTIDQGERLTFQNTDIQSHDVSSTQGLFSTPLIGTGEEALVERSQYLTAGSYPFVCSIHLDMRGTLTVTSAGTPAPRPGGGSGGGGGGGGGSGASDRSAPKVSLKVRGKRLGRVRASGRLRVEVKVDEGAKVGLSATARVRGKRVTVAAGGVELTGAGTRREDLVLTRAGKKALRRARRVKVVVSARAVDGAGNGRTARARATLKR